MKTYPLNNHRFTLRLLAVATATAFSSSGTAVSKETPAAEAKPAPQEKTATAPLFEGTGPHKRKVTTRSADAQRYFDQRLNWTFAFNHDEAIRSFGQAAKLDPDCATAYWGEAFCHGPHINNPVMNEPASLAAW